MYTEILDLLVKENWEVPKMKNENVKPEAEEDPEYYGAGYSVFFREDKLLSYSEIYNWWKLKRIISEMMDDEGFRKDREYHLLDMGCSRGHDMFRLNKELSQFNFKLSGYDIIPQDIEFAKRVALKFGLEKVDFKVANAENPGYSDNSFDVITASEVMEHQEKPKLVLQECHRILKPGGIMIITTPNTNYNDIIPKRLRKRLKTKVRAQGARMPEKNQTKKRKEMPYEKHVFVMNVVEWKKTLSQMGFKVEELRRGSLVYGGPFFDRHVKLMGLLLFFDDVLDHLTYDRSWNIIIKARKSAK
jgi:ubiquinone/menaquinone biosynthesis C-methylase UbiE